MAHKIEIPYSLLGNTQSADIIDLGDGYTPHLYKEVYDVQRTIQNIVSLNIEGVTIKEVALDYLDLVNAIFVARRKALSMAESWVSAEVIRRCFAPYVFIIDYRELKRVEKGKRKEFCEVLNTITRLGRHVDMHCIILAEMNEVLTEDTAFLETINYLKCGKEAM